MRLGLLFSWVKFGLNSVEENSLRPGRLMETVGLGFGLGLGFWVRVWVRVLTVG